MIVAIHQPNFFPWLGYFNKLVRSDIFIVLDDVQFPKKGGTWMNRVQISREGSGTWLTAPIDRSFSGVRTVSESRFDSESDWRSTAWRKLDSSYGSASCWSEIRDTVSGLAHFREDSVMEFNLGAIRGLMGLLGLRLPDLRLSSEFGLAVSGTERLTALVQAVGGSAYLCGAGSGGYLETGLFADRGLELRYQNFKPLAYPQVGADRFIGGLSVLDALANLGTARTAELIQDAADD